MKLKTDIVRDGDNITSATVSFENENISEEIENKDLPDEFGVTLVRFINKLHKVMVESNGADIKAKFETMRGFYGNTLTILLEKKK